MSEIVNTLPYSADLSKSLDKTDLHTLFVMGDNQAHRFELEILSGSKAVDLTSATVTGYFTNFKEDTTVTVPGKVEGGKAVVVLTKPCYTLHGQFVLAIQVKSGEVEDTVFLGEGFMRRTKGETIIYDDYIVYDVNTLLAQISAMKTATENANKAAADANAAAEHAPYVDEATGYWMYWDVGAGKYVNTGTPATGPQGAPGNDGEDGETPYIGSNGNWWIGQTDTGVKAQGPAGANGTGSGTVTGVRIGENTYEPDSAGLVDMSGMTAPNAASLNGNSADKFAQIDLEEAEDAGDILLTNADLLAGKSLAQIMLMMYPVGAIYTSTVATSPAALFGGTWESIGGRFLLGADSTYTAGSTGGEVTHKLTVSEMPQHRHESRVQWNRDGASTVNTLMVNETAIQASTLMGNLSVDNGDQENIGVQGGDQPHNNMPPYLSVYMWKRTA